MGIIFSPAHFYYANILAICTHMGPNKHSIFWNAHLLSKLYCQRAIQILIPSWTTFQMPHSAVYKVTPRINYWKQIFQHTAVRADAPNINIGSANNCTTPLIHSKIPHSRLSTLYIVHFERKAKLDTLLLIRTCNNNIENFYAQRHANCNAKQIMSAKT